MGREGGRVAVLARRRCMHRTCIFGKIILLASFGGEEREKVLRTFREFGAVFYRIRGVVVYSCIVVKCCSLGLGDKLSAILLRDWRRIYIIHRGFLRNLNNICYHIKHIIVLNNDKIVQPESYAYYCNISTSRLENDIRADLKASLDIRPGIVPIMYCTLLLQSWSTTNDRWPE